MDCCFDSLSAFKCGFELTQQTHNISFWFPSTFWKHSISVKKTFTKNQKLTFMSFSGNQKLLKEFTLKLTFHNNSLIASHTKPSVCLFLLLKTS